MRLARANAFGANLRVAAALYRQAIAEADPESATRAEAEEGLAVALMRMLEDLPTAAQHAANATELAKRLGDGHALAEFRASHALIVGLRGDPRALGLMQRVEGVEAFDAESDFGPSRFLRTLWGTGFMSSVLRVFADDLDEARAGLELARARAVEAGDEASLPLLLRYLSLVELLAGDWSRAERLADEGYEASLQTGQPSQQAVLAASNALIAAHRGNVEATRATADEALRLGEETGSGFAELLARSALGLLELSLANPDRAAEELEPLVDAIEAAGVGEPGVARFVPDAIEARIAVGRLGDAATLLASHEERARRLDRPSALAAAGRCRALLLAARTDFDGALASVGEALAQHARVAIPFERGRTLLVLGAVQRRAKRKRAAREALEEALAVFERLGARLFAEQARLELGPHRWARPRHRPTDADGTPGCRPRRRRAIDERGCRDALRLSEDCRGTPVEDLRQAGHPLASGAGPRALGVSVARRKDRGFSPFLFRGRPPNLGCKWRGISQRSTRRTAATPLRARARTRRRSRARAVCATCERSSSRRTKRAFTCSTQPPRTSSTELQERAPFGLSGSPRPSRSRARH